MGLGSDGILWGWGHDSYGQVGNGAGVDSKSPYLLSARTSWTK